jgi:hypothetical protein
MDQRRAFAFIFCTVTLDMLAAGLMIPVLPHLILDFMSNDTAGAARVSACSRRCGRRCSSSPRRCSA